MAFDGLAMFLSLLVYWYTAKAFGSCFGDNFTQKTDYFTYVVIGEVFLAIPHILFISVSRAVRTAIGDGSLEIYLSLPTSGFSTFLILASAQIPREICRHFIVLLIAVFAFHIHVSPFGFLQSIALQLLAWPTFIGLGFIAAAVLIIFGRGAPAIGQFSNLLLILAGAYFPISVFPSAIGTISKLFSPFTQLLDATRSLLAGGDFPWFVAAVLCVFSFVFLALGYVAFMWSLKILRRRGSPLLLPN